MRGLLRIRSEGGIDDRDDGEDMRYEAHGKYDIHSLGDGEHVG